jgi:hypothetical protein
MQITSGTSIVMISTFMTGVVPRQHAHVVKELENVHLELEDAGKEGAQLPDVGHFILAKTVLTCSS